MRVLIISALFAVSAAAPSGLYAPIIAVKTVGIPAVIPTISPGDIQAAAIDAEVQARDAAQAAVDKARELAEQASENINEKAITDSTVGTEANLDAFWSVEDKKWQAIDALKTVEAKIDGAVASNANLLAKSALSGVVPYVAGVGPISPIIAPIPPAVYTPYIATSYSSQNIITTPEKAGIKEENKEAAVKTAEPAKEEPAKVEPVEGEMKVESTEPLPVSPALKAAENLNEKPALVGHSGVISAPLSLYRYDVAFPAVGPVIGQPLLNYASPVHGVLTPTFVKTVW